MQIKIKERDFLSVVPSNLRDQNAFSHSNWAEPHGSINQKQWVAK